MSHTPSEWRVMHGRKLLEHPRRKKLLREISDIVALPDNYLQKLYVDAICQFAQLVQRLPASESHHHASDDGLLDHSLEVVLAALKIRRGLLLPVGTPPESGAKLSDLWTYAVFSSALLHDVGKICFQQHVIFSAHENFEPSTRWIPTADFLPIDYYYKVANYISERMYHDHERVTPLLATRVLPKAGLSWLGSDIRVLREWSACLVGDKEHGGSLINIVSQADRISVAANLGARDQTNIVSTSTEIPLHRKLLTALRHLLTTSELPINRDGAAGWLVDDALWLVSKRAADAIRDQLVKDNQTGIPTRNDRLFDVLQEHRIIIANGDNAIWRARVKGATWPNEHVLTLLRFNASLIWPTGNRPPAFLGTVTTVSDESTPNVTTNRVESNNYPDTESISTHAKAGVDTETSTATNESLQIVTDAESVPENTESNKISPFIQWLTNGLKNKSISINVPNARVHTVDNGVLLVSPAIFRDFATADGDGSAWEKLQKKFLKQKDHLVTPNNSNLFHYRIEKPGGNYREQAAIVKGFVVPTAIFYGGYAFPSPNPVLKRVETVT